MCSSITYQRYSVLNDELRDFLAKEGYRKDIYHSVVSSYLKDRVNELEKEIKTIER